MIFPKQNLHLKLMNKLRRNSLPQHIALLQYQSFSGKWFGIKILPRFVDLTAAETIHDMARRILLMTKGAKLLSRIFGVTCVMVFASSLALAQASQDTNAASSEQSAPSDVAPKAKGKRSEKKQQSGNQPDKAASSEAKPKRGQYGSEAEAKAHCKGEVVWVDKDHFNHYAGSREYGRKPGAFACENG
jgi:hypothetical protein